MTRLVHRLIAWATAHPLAAPLLAGAIARLLAAWVGLGFHARDDYFHVLEPALQWLGDPGYDWDASGTPGAGIRSHLVPRLVWLLLRLGQSLGITEPESLLRLIYSVVGAYSLSLVPAMFLLGRRLLDDRGAALATWLAAVHLAMPYAGTRLLIEAMAMPPFVFGLWLATYPAARRQLAAGLVLGLACWFRFQTGSAVLGVMIVVAILAYKGGGLRTALGRTAALATGGIVAIGAQGLFDLWTTGDFLGPMLRNIFVNLDPDPALSRSTPFAYLGIFLLLTVPPATIVVLPAMLRAARSLSLVTVPFVAFFVFHSLVPHKEERFMLPVLPLFLILLAAAPQALAQAQGPIWARLKRWARPTWILVAGVHVAALLLAVTSQSQANLREAMTRLRHDSETRAIVSMGPELQTYFLGRPKVPTYRTSEVDAVWLGRTLRQAQEEPPNRFLAFAPDRLKAELLLLSFGMACAPAEVIDGWWFDRLLYELNSHRNRRRAPVLLWRCEPPALALR
jgi:hypothetical protein